MTLKEKLDLLMAELDTEGVPHDEQVVRLEQFFITELRVTQGLYIQKMTETRQVLKPYTDAFTFTMKTLVEGA